MAAMAAMVPKTHQTGITWPWQKTLMLHKDIGHGHGAGREAAHVRCRCWWTPHQIGVELTCAEGGVDVLVNQNPRASLLWGRKQAESHAQTSTFHTFPKSKSNAMEPVADVEKKEVSGGANRLVTCGS